MKIRSALAFALISTSALAQTAAPTADQIREEATGIISALRQQRDANADQLAQAAAQIAKLQKELAALKDAGKDAKGDAPKK